MGCIYYRLKFTHDFSAQEFKVANNYENFLAIDVADAVVAIDVADAVVVSVDVVVANRRHCEFLPSAVEQLL